MTKVFIAVPSISDVNNYLGQLKIRLNKIIQNTIKNNHQKVTEITSRYIFTNPITIYQAKEMQYDNVLERLIYASKSVITKKQQDFLTLKNSYILQKPYQILEKKGNKYLQLISKLETLSPLLTLKRGYTMTRYQDQVITSYKQVKKDDILEIEFQDGKINSKVI